VTVRRLLIKVNSRHVEIHKYQSDKYRDVDFLRGVSVTKDCNSWKLQGRSARIENVIGTCIQRSVALICLVIFVNDLQQDGHTCTHVCAQKGHRCTYVSRSHRLFRCIFLQRRSCRRPAFDSCYKTVHAVISDVVNAPV